MAEYEDELMPIPVVGDETSVLETTHSVSTLHNTSLIHMITDYDTDTLTYNLTEGEKLYMASMAYRFKVVMSEPHNAISVALGLVATLSNILLLLALTQVQSTLSSYFKLLMSLSISDVLMGIILVLHKTSKILVLPHRVGLGPWDDRLRSRCINMVIRALFATSLNSTLLNLMAMALDHYIAILRPLHYNIYVNNRRRNILIALVWVIAALLGFSNFFSGIKLKDKLPMLNYCEVISLSYYQEEFCTFVLALLCCCTITYIYITIYMEVRKQQRRELQPRDFKKNKKAFVTTLLILGSFILCWLPLCLFQVSMIIQVQVDRTKVDKIAEVYYKADKYLLNLLSLNAICDVLIYAFRLKEIRQGYNSLFYHCCKVVYKHRGGDHRRQSETITLDYSLSMTSSQRRKSSSITSNESIARKTEKSNSTHSTHSFATLPTVIEHERNEPTTNENHHHRTEIHQAHENCIMSVGDNNTVSKEENIADSQSLLVNNVSKNNNRPKVSNGNSQQMNGIMKSNRNGNVCTPLIVKGVNVDECRTLVDKT